MFRKKKSKMQPLPEGMGVEEFFQQQIVESGRVPIGSIAVTIQAGLWHCHVTTLLLGDPQILGDTLDELHMEVDYEEARESIAESLLVLADRFKSDPLIREEMNS